MQPRTRNEKILLAILAAIIFLGGNFYGYRWLAQKQTSLELKAAEMRGDEAEAKIVLQQADLWAKRSAWIKEHQPDIGDEGESKAKVLDTVTKGARDHKLEIIEQSLNDVQHGESGTHINVAIKVKGSMQDLCQWLTEIEKPDQFYAVALFSLKADQDQKSMVCTLQVARYFKGTSP